MIIPKPTHTFHIPVMGLAFTIDSPVRVAQYGIDSVISIMDDDLIEQMSAFYAKKMKQPYNEISKKVDDFRAKRITNYLDLVDKIVKEKFEKFKTDLVDKKSELDYFLKLLPSNSDLSERIKKILESGKNSFQEIKAVLEQNLNPGSIDVNIMTKVDKDNFQNKEALSTEFNDAHAALRGFANSTVKSSVIFSAGMNPRLFSYMESFDNFYPNKLGEIDKKIILKVSDFRSALIQGNYLAKRGLWVSEYRIESGLNCGGHAFATEGYLLGPILEEFKTKKQTLITSSLELLVKALEAKGKTVPSNPLNIKITVQGGVGTSKEHQFLLDYYQVDAVGWGSPFLLVPEATSVDKNTRELLANAKEEDLYLSNISPLGVPFNTVKGMTNDFYKQERIKAGKAGSSCPKKYLALSKEYDAEGICTASKKYQDIKISELNDTKEEISAEVYQEKMNKITEKACLCVGLANATHLELGFPIKGQKQGVVVCPGPNIAYFSKEEVSLQEMVQHIYGSKAMKIDSNRPNLFVKELSLYITHFFKLVEENNNTLNKKLEKFKANLKTGIDYYRTMFLDKNLNFNLKDRMDLEALERKL